MAASPAPARLLRYRPHFGRTKSTVVSQKSARGFEYDSTVVPSSFFSSRSMDPASSYFRVTRASIQMFMMADSGMVRTLPSFSVSTTRLFPSASNAM